MGGDDILKMAVLLKLLYRLNNLCSLLVWDLLLLHDWKEMWSYLPYCAFEPTILFLGVLLLFSCSVMSDSLQPYGLQHSSLPCPSPSPQACSNPCPSSWWAIQPSHPLSSPSPPVFNLSEHQGLFKWISSSHQVVKYWSFSFTISPSSEYSGLISFMID